MDNGSLYTTVETLTRIIVPPLYALVGLGCLPLAYAPPLCSIQAPGELHAGGAGADNQHVGIL